MSLKGYVEIDVGNYFSVDDNKRVTIKQRAGVVDAAARSQDFRRFNNIVQLHTKPAAITQRLANGFGPVMKIDEDFIAAVAREVFSDITDQWFAESGDSG